MTVQNCSCVQPPMPGNENGLRLLRVRTIANLLSILRTEPVKSKKSKNRDKRPASDSPTTMCMPHAAVHLSPSRSLLRSRKVQNVARQRPLRKISSIKTCHARQSWRLKQWRTCGGQDDQRGDPPTRRRSTYLA